MEKINLENPVLAGELKAVINVENLFSKCCIQLNELIKNGKIREQLKYISRTAIANSRLLHSYLNNEDVSNFSFEDKCQYCHLKPESLSLSGVIDMGLEIIDLAIRHYRSLQELNISMEHNEAFERIIKEKYAQRELLKKEKGFHDYKEEGDKIIKDFCIPLFNTFSYK